MANDGCTHLAEYASYFKHLQEFVANLNYEDDRLPSNLKCRTGQEELVGECVDWTLRYLRLTDCPQSLLAPLTKAALDRVHIMSGESSQDSFLLPNMVEVVNEVCFQYCGDNNAALKTLPPPRPIAPPQVSACAIKNTRRRMENRHAIVEDLDTIFDITSSGPTYYYGLFDGHSGVDAATYCSTHMHCFITTSPNYPSHPEKALKDAFARTDLLFTEKCNQENIQGGCTALCVLHRPVERRVYTAWTGDSQAILVSQGRINLLVNPHKPDRADERKRIEQAGGVVLYYGAWRVNGTLAVSRAIGDVKHKPFISGEPDVTSTSLDGSEDFIVIGCDGLWDSVKVLDVAQTVYEQLQTAPGDVAGLSQSLVSLARREGSTDNISVLVVLLRPAADIPVPSKPCWVVGADMDILDAVDNANNPFLAQATNGGHSAVYDQGECKYREHHEDQDDDDEDMGPETDIDTVDDVLVSPASNPFLEKTSLDKHEVLALAMGSGVDDDQPASLEPHEQLEPLEPLEQLEPQQLVKGVAEVDNVESEESEEEWNYFRVEPTADKPAVSQNIEDCAEDEMESQLNPNAAVFVPLSPTEGSNHKEQPFNENLTQEEFFNKGDVMSSSFIAHDVLESKPEASPALLNGAGAEEICLASSPMKGAGVSMDNIATPSEAEFSLEVRSRPGDLESCPEEQLNSDPLAAEVAREVLDDDLLSSEVQDAVVESEPEKHPQPALVDDSLPKETSSMYLTIAEETTQLSPSLNTGMICSPSATVLAESQAVPSISIEHSSNPVQDPQDCFSDIPTAHSTPLTIESEEGSLFDFKTGGSETCAQDSTSGFDHTTVLEFCNSKKTPDLFSPSLDADSLEKPIPESSLDMFATVQDNEQLEDQHLIDSNPSLGNVVDNLPLASSEICNENAVDLPETLPLSTNDYENNLQSEFDHDSTLSADVYRASDFEVPNSNEPDVTLTATDELQLPTPVDNISSISPEPESDAFSAQAESHFAESDVFEAVQSEKDASPEVLDSLTSTCRAAPASETSALFLEPTASEAAPFLEAAPASETAASFLEPTVAEAAPFLESTKSETGHLQEPTASEATFFQEPTASEAAFFQEPTEPEIVSFQEPTETEIAPFPEPVLTGTAPLMEPISPKLAPCLETAEPEAPYEPETAVFQSPDVQVQETAFLVDREVPDVSSPAAEEQPSSDAQIVPADPAAVGDGDLNKTDAAESSLAPALTAVAVAAAASATAVVGAAKVAAASKTDTKKAASKPLAAKPKAVPAAKGPAAPSKPPTKPAPGAGAGVTARKAAAPLASRAAPAKPKPSEVSLTKTAAAAPVKAPQRPKPAPSAPAKPLAAKPLTNGDAAKVKPPTAAARPASAPSRTAGPSSTTQKAAPAAARPAGPVTGAVKKPSTVSTATKPRPVTEVKPSKTVGSTTAVAPRPRPASAAASSAKPSTTSKVSDKQAKDTTNKIISSRSTAPRTQSVANRTTVAKSSSAANAAAASAAAAAAAKAAAATKPAPIRRPTSATTTAAKSAITKKSSKPTTNGHSHDNAVEDKREPVPKIEEMLIDNQLVENGLLD